MPDLAYELAAQVVNPKELAASGRVSFVIADVGNYENANAPKCMFSKAFQSIFKSVAIAFEPFSNAMNRASAV